MKEPNVGRKNARIRKRKERSGKATISLTVPKGLRQEFKMQCWRRNQTMRDVILQAMHDKLRKMKGVPGNEDEW